MTQPELTTGDSGDGVLALQSRLHALGLYDGAVDGAYGERTATAVGRLQELHGMEVSSTVDARTWEAVAEAEQRAAPRLPADGAAAAVAENQQWHWDGEQWQPADNVPRGAPGDVAAHISSDGHWLWDGATWQPVT